MAKSLDDRPVFMVSDTKDGKKFLLIGVPDGATRALKDKMGHDFDLSSAGIPIYVSVMYGRSHKDIMRQIDEIAREANITLDNRLNKDFSIK